jgi:hypothetical protein
MFWREVTQEIFYKAIGDLNCHPHIVGNYPYTSIFRLNTNPDKWVGKVESGGTKKPDKYFLPTTS